MANTNRKTKMISLRLSNEEYETLHNLYRAHGSRSISDFARNAMQKVISGAAPSRSLETRLQELDGKMSALDHEVSRLVKLLEDRAAPAVRTASL